MSVGPPDGRFERICAEAGAEPIWLENLPWPEIAALRGVNGGMLLLPLGAALLFYLFLTYAKFGAFSGMPLRYSANPVQRQFAVQFPADVGIGQVPAVLARAVTR